MFMQNVLQLDTEPPLLRKNHDHAFVFNPYHSSSKGELLAHYVSRLSLIEWYYLH